MSNTYEDYDMARMRIDDGGGDSGSRYTQVSIEGGPCVQIKTEKGTVFIDREDWFLMVRFVDHHMDSRLAKKTE